LKDWLDPSSTGSTTLDGKYGILPPEPPSNLVITNAGQTNASPNLSWTASPSSNVTHYEIYRCPSYYRNCFSYGTTIATTTGTSYTDFGVIITTQSQAYDEFFYRVRAISSDDVASAYTNWASVWGDTFQKRGPLEEEALPAVFALEQNHPNPFNPQTQIRFALPEAVPVSLVIYDVTGREIARLAEGVLEAGYHTVAFEGTSLPSGIYLYRLQAGDFVETKRMALVK
jgi:hypothetical protein